MLDILNMRISGLETLRFDYEVKKCFGRMLCSGTVYRTDFPEGSSVVLKVFSNKDSFEELEGDVVEYLFELVISGDYRDWSNYGLVLG